MRDVREILKSILTTDMTGVGKGGLMLPEQTTQFLDLTLEYSTMLQLVRNEKKTNPKGETDTLNIGEVVTEGASEAPGDGSSPDEEVKPTFGKLEYTMKKLRSMFDISTESLLDNIEAEQLAALQNTAEGGPTEGGPSGDFRDKLMRAYAKRISTDVELLAIQGDSTIVSTSTKLNRLLKQNDGWDALTASGVHLVDVGYKNISKNLFAAMLKAMPSPYMKRIKDLRWFLGPITNINWKSTLAERLTMVGDEALKGGDMAPFGIPMVMIPLIPEDKTKTVGTTNYTGLSFIWLTFPENFIFLQRRYVETYWEFKPRRDKWENTTYSETDQLIENLDCIVKAINLKVDSATAY